MSIALIPVAIHAAKAVKGSLTDDGTKLTLGVIGVLAFSAYLKPGAPLPPPMRLLRQGSRAVVADSGFHRTAIKRSSPSKPFAHFRAQGLVTGQVLDFGSGRGADCRGTKIRCYDPNHPTPQVRNLPLGPFDTVAAIYVVNVLPKPQRHAALREAGAKVKRGGHLLLAARGQGDEGFNTAQSGWGQARRRLHPDRHPGRASEIPAILPRGPGPAPGGLQGPGSFVPVCTIALPWIGRGSRGISEGALMPKVIRGKKWVHRSALSSLSPQERAQVKRTAKRVPDFRWTVARVGNGSVMLGRTTPFTNVHPELLESVTREEPASSPDVPMPTRRSTTASSRCCSPAIPESKKATARTATEAKAGLLGRPDIGRRSSWKRSKAGITEHRGSR